MPSFKIFTEGKSDIKFLKDYILDVFNVDLSLDLFDPLGSWSGYKAGGDLKASIKENFENENHTILILDADSDYKARKNQIENDFAGFGVPLLLFQFPDNKGNGNLEDLLSAIATDQKLINCFGEYEKCVELYPKKLNHSRIYAYLDLLLLDNYKDLNGKDMRQDEFRNYRNNAHWNLKHEKLNSLREFLSQIDFSL